MVNNIPVNGWPQLKDLEAVQPTLDRLDKIEAWKRTVKEETFTGEELTIENALALPARSLITSINAIQDLHGYDKPWAGGAGKNKVETPSATAFTARGITLTTASNGETTLNGTSTAGSIDGDTFELPAGTYTISVGTTLPSGIWVSLDGVGGAMISPTGQSISFTTTEAISTFTHIYVNAGVAFNNFKLNWMLESGSTATSYAPYSNICPISGRDSVVLTRSDGDEISEDFTIQLGQTVYGADINWDTGVGTIDRVKVSKTWGQMSNATDLGNGVTRKLCDRGSIGALLPISVESISNVCAYLGSGWNDPVIRWFHDDTNAFFYLPSDTPSDLLCEWIAPLATPTTIQLTPEQLEMLKGYNRVTLSDGYGTIELKALTGANWS